MLNKLKNFINKEEEEIVDIEDNDIEDNSTSGINNLRNILNNEKIFRKRKDNVEEFSSETYEDNFEFPIYDESHVPETKHDFNLIDEEVKIINDDDEINLVNGENILDEFENQEVVLDQKDISKKITNSEIISKQLDSLNFLVSKRKSNIKEDKQSIETKSEKSKLKKTHDKDFEKETVKRKNRTEINSFVYKPSLERKGKVSDFVSPMYGNKKKDQKIISISEDSVASKTDEIFKLFNNNKQNGEFIDVQDIVEKESLVFSSPTKKKIEEVIIETPKEDDNFLSFFEDETAITIQDSDNDKSNINDLVNQPEFTLSKDTIKFDMITVEPKEIQKQITEDIVTQTKNHFEKRKQEKMDEVDNELKEVETLLSDNGKTVEIPPIDDSKNSIEDLELIDDNVSNDGVDFELEIKKEEPPAIIKKPYVKPDISFLNDGKKTTVNKDKIEANKALLQSLFDSFSIPAKVDSYVVGPSVINYEVIVDPGVRVSKILNLKDNMKLTLGTTSLRIQAPIPGKNAIGIETINPSPQMISLKQMIEDPKFKKTEHNLFATLGISIDNKPVYLDITKMPHALIAGATGSGKSVCINSILVSLLYKNSPTELKLVLIDPKMVELGPYNNIPHLVTPVVTDPKKAAATLIWAVNEMEDRYRRCLEISAKDIISYNSQVSKDRKMPYIVIVIDELADLMMIAAKDVEESITRIAQKSRAVGIHLIIATQRPSVDVVTGLIKANVPTRIAFAVSSSIDSRTILDQMGAEDLFGKGDLLFIGNGSPNAERLQAPFISENEVNNLIAYLQQFNYQTNDELKIKLESNIQSTLNKENGSASASFDDDLVDEIVHFIIDNGKVSTSLLQRKFRIGYNRASRIIDDLEEIGVISSQDGIKPRIILVTLDEWEDLKSENR